MKLKNSAIAALIVPALLYNLSINAETIETCPSAELIKKCEHNQSSECAIHNNSWNIKNTEAGNPLYFLYALAPTHERISSKNPLEKMSCLYEVDEGQKFILEFKNKNLKAEIDQKNKNWNRTPDNYYFCLGNKKVENCDFKLKELKGVRLVK
jgi:hypothetical protein